MSHLFAIGIGTDDDTRSNILTVAETDTNEYNLILNIPTNDPGVIGALWNDSGILKISSGPVVS